MESHQDSNAKAVSTSLLQGCCLHGTPKRAARLPEEPGGFGIAPSCPVQCLAWEADCFFLAPSRIMDHSQSDQEGCSEVSTTGAHHHGHWWEAKHAHHWGILQEVADLTMEDGFHVWEAWASIAAILVGQDIKWHGCVQFGMAPSGSESVQDSNPDQHRTSGSQYSIDLPQGCRGRAGGWGSHCSQEEKEEDHMRLWVHKDYQAPQVSLLFECHPIQVYESWGNKSIACAIPTTCAIPEA